MKKRFYEILGISKSADAAEIKKGISQNALQYHPDKTWRQIGRRKFKLAAEAYGFKRSSESQIRSIRSSSFDGLEVLAVGGGSAVV
jgi:DnaJ-class molecular chaperone